MLFEEGDELVRDDGQVKTKKRNKMILNRTFDRISKNGKAFVRRTEVQMQLDLEMIRSRVVQIVMISQIFISVPSF